MLGKKLDPVFWIKKLIAISSTRRLLNLNSLFISTRGTVKPASRAVIAGWVKTELVSLGIKFPPGSIRSAVASSRRQNNVPLDEILSYGNWKSDKNVFKFYFKEIIKQSSAVQPV